MKTLMILAAALVSTALLAPTASIAAQTNDVVSETVAIGDLDLATAEGQAKLERRLRASARRVCDLANSRGASGSADYARCVKGAIQRAQ